MVGLNSGGTARVRDKNSLDLAYEYGNFEDLDQEKGEDEQEEERGKRSKLIIPTYDIQIKGIIGPTLQFDNLIDMEDFIEKKLSLKEGIDYKVYCRRSLDIQKTEEDFYYKCLIEQFIKGRTKLDDEIEEAEKNLSDQQLKKKEEKEKEDKKKEGKIANREKSQEKSVNKKDVSDYEEEEEFENSFEKELEANLNHEFEGPRNTKRKNQKNSKNKKDKEKKKKSPTDKNKDEPIITEAMLYSMKDKRDKMNKRIQEEINEVKELKFIDEVGMEKDIASQLDIAKRKQLEEAFPELQRFTIFCFKSDSSVSRRAIVFQSKDNESEYIETMRNFLQTYHKLDSQILRSKVKINFKGKYVLKLNLELYLNFKDTIEKILKENKIQNVVKPTTTKVEIQLMGKLDNPRAVKETYEKLTDLFRGDEFTFVDEEVPMDKYEFYALFSERGDNRIQNINNLNSKELFVEVDKRYRKVRLRGFEKNKKEAISDLRNL